MHILDTDHMSLLEWGSPGSAALRGRLADLAADQVVTTIISYEEQIRGWMAYIARAKSLSRQVQAYQRLKSQLDYYRHIPVVDFDSEAAAVFQYLRRAGIRIGAMDLKIAAIALSRGATLLSRNLADFGKIPGLNVEDWTA